mmetsp:Transcript_106852/g.189896  ORF Transcript_106852/g.189896 Transcript_106852/m.189896 type:complete len:286 (+) Transcript_106852:24-881(+)
MGRFGRTLQVVWACRVGAHRSFSTAGPSTKLLETEMVDGVALVKMLAPEGNFPWGTRIFEHRINPLLIQQVNAALDEAESAGAQALVVAGEGKFFCNGMDLQYMSVPEHKNQSTQIQTDAEMLMARILTLGMPTVAAVNGHFAAAGAMLGLAFDQRVMSSDSPGLFFVPGIDIGLVYSKGMTELMKAKMPLPMWNDVMCMAKRYKAAELLQNGVVNDSPASAELVNKALEIAVSLKSKGKDEKTRATMRGIKHNLYQDAVAALGKEVEDMGFNSGTFDATGRAKK